MSVSKEVRHQPHFEGVKRVVQFNWSWYLLAIVVATVLYVTAGLSDVPALARTAAGAIATLIILQSVVSLLVSHWIYDLSAITSWTWLLKSVSDPARIIIVHAGYDETDGAIPKIFRSASVSTVDLYDSLKRKEKSIKRARELHPPSGQPIGHGPSNWPAEDESMDLILIAFAAHELRDRPSREQLFIEAKRVIRRDKPIIVVEHLRDFANFVAFNVGAFHFHSQHEWLDCFRSAGLQMVEHLKMTPFVSVFVLQR